MTTTIEHTCDVVEVILRDHPNADSLSLVDIWDFQCAVRTADWNNGDLAVYIPPDSVVPDTKEFAFLDGHRRIKVKKLRGEWSMGLLIKAPSGSKIGDDCMESLGITHYEPQIHGHFSTGGDNVPSPPGFLPIYDILNFREYSRLFVDDEEVICTEKTHGTSSRYICTNDQMYCGSHKHWKKEDPNNLWWKALTHNPAIEAWCRHNQNLGLYGEVFGQVQKLKYGSTRGELWFAGFDIWDGKKWLDYDDARSIAPGIPWVPSIYRGPYNKDMILAFAEGDSLYPSADHIREGTVIKPIHERVDPRLGRVQLKVVGNGYLSKS